MRFDNSYLDFDDNFKELTEAELQYFRDTVNEIQQILDVEIPIYNRNHEKDFVGKHKEALGIFYTNDKDYPQKDCFITIDNFFIHECYEEKYHGAYNLSFQTLEEVICHEIAHSEQLRHCKRHERITQELLGKVKSFQEGSLDMQIAAAKARGSKKSRKSTEISMESRENQRKEMNNRE